jgi:dTDP-4-amino-4,6-dideoxygalactose transaminase
MKEVAKQKIADLARFGGAPEFGEVLHVGRPNLGDRDRLMARIEEALDRNWLTNDGPFVQAFEREVAAATGTRHCVAMCNGTAALEVATRAMGLSGEVIVPSFTFVATAHALRWQGITPVFCDIDPATHVIDPAQIEALVSHRTTAVLGVHLWGNPCAVEALAEATRRHDIQLLFDASHAFGCTHRGLPVGGFGRVEVFSFHATKFVNTFEGGAAVTNDDALAERMRRMRNFGFAGYDNVVSLGTNAKMNEVAAIMGLTSLESIDHFVDVNRRNYEVYREALDGVPGISFVDLPDDDRRNYQYVVLEVDPEEAGLTRDSLMDLLWAENVRARRYFYPGLHRMEPYRSELGARPVPLRQTELVASRVLVLPTGTSVDAETVSRVAALIRFAIANADAVRAAEVPA